MNDTGSELEIGTGATEQLSLRVSVAVLVRLLFQHPVTKEWMLALERRATLVGDEVAHFVEVKSQPFGGALRILDARALRRAIGEFHFDSERARRQQDFRIFIKPSAWQAVRAVSLDHLSQPYSPVLESDPWRELSEEFAATIQADLRREQLTYAPVGTIIQDTPSPTGNAYARDYSTARIYRIFEARIGDADLVHALMINSDRYANSELQELALAHARDGGRGWANAILALPLNQLRAAYVALLPEERDLPISFQDHRLDETVAAILDGVSVPKYQTV
jgi:hypothetical protein